MLTWATAAPTPLQERQLTLSAPRAFLARARPQQVGRRRGVATHFIFGVCGGEAPWTLTLVAPSLLASGQLYSRCAAAMVRQAGTTLARMLSLLLPRRPNGTDPPIRRPTTNEAPPDKSMRTCEQNGTNFRSRRFCLSLPDALATATSLQPAPYPAPLHVMSPGKYG